MVGERSVCFIHHNFQFADAAAIQYPPPKNKSLRRRTKRRTLLVVETPRCGVRNNLERL